MSVIELPRAFDPTGVDGALMSWWDADAECTVAIARPSDNDALWQEYLDGAERRIASTGSKRRSTSMRFAGPATRRCSGRCSTAPGRWSVESAPSVR